MTKKKIQIEITPQQIPREVPFSSAKIMPPLIHDLLSDFLSCPFPSFNYGPNNLLSALTLGSPTL
jgi:hypothetical protein